MGIRSLVHRMSAPKVESRSAVTATGTWPNTGEMYGRTTSGIDVSVESALSNSAVFAAVRKDGSTVDVEVKAMRATYLGQPAIIGMMQDISGK